MNADEHGSIACPANLLPFSRNVIGLPLVWQRFQMNCRVLIVLAHVRIQRS